MESIKIIAEFGGKNWSGYSPNLPGVYATGSSLAQLGEEFVAAARFHVDGLAEAGEAIPYVDMGTYVLSPIVYLENLGDLRKSVGLNQSDVAGQLGVGQSRVSEIENRPESVSFGVVRQYLSVIETHAELPPLAMVSKRAESRLAV